VIQGKPQDQAGEIEDWGPRYDARCGGIASLLAGRAHVGSSYLPGNAPKVRIGAGATTWLSSYPLTTWVSICGH
jgi:hypothetical protein